MDILMFGIKVFTLIIYLHLYALLMYGMNCFKEH